MGRTEVRMLENLRPGEALARREVHRRYGGRQQGGISPSRVVPAVMFFTDPATGHKHGYYDGWDDDGLFNYVGEGQTGNQRLVQGNRAILDHAAEGRSLEGFRSRGVTATYLGEFALVDHYWTEAHESGGELLRQVVVFRMRPLGKAPADLPAVPYTKTSRARVDAVSAEAHNTERAFVRPNASEYEAERREAIIVGRYSEHLRSLGHVVGRLRVVPAGEAAPLYSDLWDQTASELFEAKSLGTREQLRMAVGQLADYGRFAPGARRTVLLPTRPRPDLCMYLRSVGVGAVFPEGDGWARIG